MSEVRILLRELDLSNLLTLIGEMPYKDKEKQKQFQNEWVKNRRAQINKAVTKARRERLEYIHSFKQNPCTDCGHSYDPCVMDFHHRNSDDKVVRVSRMANERWPYEEIDKEIAKCDLLCANCHRLRHKKELQ